MNTCSAKTWISNGPMEREGYVTPVWVLGCRAAVPQCAEAECSYTGHGGRATVHRPHTAPETARRTGQCHDAVERCPIHRAQDPELLGGMVRQ